MLKIRETKLFCGFNFGKELRAIVLFVIFSRQIIYLIYLLFSELEQRKKMLSGEEREVDEKLYNLIVKFQGDRIEEQRSTLGGPSPVEKDVSDIVLKMASGRIDEQRADLKSPTSKSSGKQTPTEN